MLVDVDLATGSKANGVPPSRLTKLKIDTLPPQRACKYAAPAAKMHTWGGRNSSCGHLRGI
ncbi:MAG: hypothetical protein VYB66_05965 [Verrucomicrobiota bacterium]|nr:hypothetical protein [Verrucomicrobiota bacterium]